MGFLTILFVAVATSWVLMIVGYIANVQRVTPAKRAKIIDRAKKDWYMLRRNIHWYLLGFLVVLYLHGVIARMLAFYRHKPLAAYVDDPSHLLDHRLKDLGFEVFTDLSESPIPEVGNELLQYGFAYALFHLVTRPYINDMFRPDETPTDRVYSVWISLRIGMALTTAQALRPLVFLVTSIPGPAPHCMGAKEAANHPSTVWEIFFHPHTGANCGDLCFSGHLVFCITAVFGQFMYLPMVTSKSTSFNLRAAHIVMLVVQIVLILSSRSHYTMDLSVAAIVGYFNWYHHLLKWRVFEPPFEKGMIRGPRAADYDEGPGKWATTAPKSIETAGKAAVDDVKLLDPKTAQLEHDSQTALSGSVSDAHSVRTDAHNASPSSDACDESHRDEAEQRDEEAPSVGPSSSSPSIVVIPDDQPPTSHASTRPTPSPQQDAPLNGSGSVAAAPS